MKTSKEIESLQEIIFHLLHQNPRYRDNDKMLCAKIWSMQMGGIDKLQQQSAYDFLVEYAKPDSFLCSQESIGRCRRKIQEENVHLRGEKYRERHDEIKAVQTQLGYY